MYRLTPSSNSAKTLVQLAKIAESLPSDPKDPKDLSTNLDYYTWEKSGQ